jgi:hypothetical protein
MRMKKLKKSEKNKAKVQKKKEKYLKKKINSELTPAHEAYFSETDYVKM